ncbi:MAG: LLM class F420-dependent oxidoreductase, partial [Dehalococcoidia bacterium]
CWHEDEAEAKRMARTHWPNAALPSPLMPELKLPEHYEAAVAFMSDDDAASAVLSGPDPDRYVAAIHQYANAGFDHIYLHQVGPDQDGFFRFYKNQVLPRLS